MKTIPQIREKLYLLAEEMGGSYGLKLKRLTRQLRRRPSVRKTKNKSRPMTKDLANRIRKVALANPHLNYMEIARLFYPLSVGRVSEAIAGKREAA